MKNKSIVKNITFLASVAGNYRFFLPLFRLMKGRYPNYADPSSDICIEGFPRSGNTFFVAAIQRWNRSLRISHHSHLASSAIYSWGRGIPTVVLIREPAGAVSSAMVWDGRIVATIGLLVYISFYRSVCKVFPQILILDFEEYTRRPDLAVEKINTALGTNLDAAVFDVAEREAIHRYLSNHDSRNKRSASNSSLPNEEKTALKRSYLQNIRKNMLFGTAQALYESIISDHRS